MAGQRYDHWSLDHMQVPASLRPKDKLEMAVLR